MRIESYGREDHPSSPHDDYSLLGHVSRVLDLVSGRYGKYRKLE
jgi:hypothetical protein